MFTLASNSNFGNNALVMIQFHEGDVIRKLREQHKLSRKKLAALVKTRAATIGRIERTGKYRPEKLRNIAQALGSSVAEIASLVPGAGFPKSAQPVPLSTEYEILDKALKGGWKRTARLWLWWLRDIMTVAPNGPQTEGIIQVGTPKTTLFKRKTTSTRGL